MLELELIEKISENLRQDNYKGETTVEKKIVNPILDALGWDTITPGQVESQYEMPDKTGQKTGIEKADYVLLINKRPQVTIEVKDVGKIKLSANRKQLFGYVAGIRTPLAILTDGKKWYIYYCSFTQDKVNDRLVRTLDLSDREQFYEIAYFLSRYLSFEEVKSKRFVDNAKKDLDNEKNRKRAKDAISKTWRRIAVNEPDKLVNILSQETEQETRGAIPDGDDIIAFLKSLKPPSKKLSKSHARTPEKSPDQATKKQKATSSKGLSWYVLLGGEKRKHEDAVVIYTEIITRLAEKYGGKNFLNRLASRLPSRYISQDKSALRFPVEIGYGWFLNKDLTNNQKRENLKIACDVAGIKFESKFTRGLGLKVHFPEK